MFGVPGKTMVEISVIGFLMGTCIAFYVVIGDLSPLIISKIFNIQSSSHDSLRRFLIILITLVCVIPLCFQKSIESLAFVCRASIGFYICLTLKIVFESFERFESDSNWFSNISLWNTAGVLQCIPIFSMAMSCQMQLFEVYETMGSSYSGSFDRIKKTVHQATFICFIVYCTVGFFGYLAFYNQTLSGNVLINLKSSLANDAITIGFILSIACSFPLVIFPCRAALASFLHRKSLHSEIASYVPESKYQPLTLFIIFSTMIIGILIPSVEVIISLVGSTVGVLVCILFPATCFVKIMQRSSAEKTFAQLIIVAGFAVMILGTYANLTAIDATPSGSHLKEKQLTIVAIPEHPKDTINVPKIVEPQPEKVQPVEENVKKKEEPEVKISDDGIKKEEQEIAAEKVEQPKDPQVAIQEKDEEIQELKDSKVKLEKEVLEMKEELVKQNKETQQLVLQKFDEIAEKVDKIEKQSMDGGGPAGAKEKAIEEVEKVKDDLVPIVAAQKFEEPVKLAQLPVPVEEEKVKPQEEVPVIHRNLSQDQLPKKIEEPKPVPAAVILAETKPEEPKVEPEPLKEIVEAKPELAKEIRVDPIVKLIKSQEPLSYQVGEKIMEQRKANNSISGAVKSPEDLKQESSEIKNEMRKKRETFDEALDSLDKTLQNFELRSMIGRDLKATKEEN